MGTIDMEKGPDREISTDYRAAFFFKCTFLYLVLGWFTFESRNQAIVFALLYISQCDWLKYSRKFFLNQSGVKPIMTCSQVVLASNSRSDWFTGRIYLRCNRLLAEAEILRNETLHF